MNSVRAFFKKNEDAFIPVWAITFAVLVCAYSICNNIKLEKQKQKNRALNSYNMTVDGFKNVLKGTYGDIAVTNTDWGNHSNYGTGDMFGQYLNDVTVSGCAENELVLVAYYTATTGATWYAVAEPGVDKASNGWDVSRNGDSVTFTVSGNNDGSYNQVAIFNPEKELLYVPAFSG